MAQAWIILLALTLARTCMGFQFQAIPALAAPLTASGGMSFAALGTLTGAYLLPGAAVALAGGWLGLKLGDARVALTGLFLMALGGFGGWLAQSFEAVLAWRVIAGIGAVGLNVLVTKMAADWFESRSDLATGMGVLVSSWPAGIAFAALGLPIVEANFGLDTALLLPALLCTFGWAVLWAVWCEPESTKAASTAMQTSWYTGREIALVVLAGLIWALYNVALVGTIAWVPGFLQAQGADPVPASASASVIGWVAIFSVAAGGWLASRMSSRDLPSLLCFAATAGLVAVLPVMGLQAGALWMMLAIGLAVGPAAAMIMTLPIEAARAHLRATTMGIYFAIYYACMGVGPAILGALRDATGDPGSPLVASAVILAACFVMWLAFRGLQRAATP